MSLADKHRKSIRQSGDRLHTSSHLHASVSRIYACRPQRIATGQSRVCCVSGCVDGRDGVARRIVVVGELRSGGRDAQGRRDLVGRGTDLQTRLPPHSVSNRVIVVCRSVRIPAAASPLPECLVLFSRVLRGRTAGPAAQREACHSEPAEEQSGRRTPTRRGCGFESGQPVLQVHHFGVKHLNLGVFLLERAEQQLTASSP